jgi:hypothetical protein
MMKMIRSAKEFVSLSMGNDPRARLDKVLKSVWASILQVYPGFKGSVIENKNVPESVLRMLAEDSNAEVRFAIAMKRKCPIDVLEKLAVDSDDSVRERVAWNASTTAPILEVLRNDRSAVVADVATRRLREERRQD